MTTFRLAIVGGGPRALTILERLAEHQGILPHGVRLDVIVVDPRGIGEGSHPSDQPEHLLINTLASQVTMYAHGSLVAPEDENCSLLDWAARIGYRRFNDAFRVSDDPDGQRLQEGDHLPRVLLGAFLRAFAKRVLAALPAEISIRHISAVVTDIRTDGQKYALTLNNGHDLTVSHIVLAMGHGTRCPTAADEHLRQFAESRSNINPNLAFLNTPYPIRCLDALADGSRVAVQGLGLTAHDVVSALTIGRGGRFLGSGDRLTYQRSGREPLIWLCSRNTLPFAARGVNQKGRTGRHVCEFFTAAAVAKIRKAAERERGDPRIDFEADVLPLVLQEMAFAHRSAETGKPVDPQTFDPTAQELAIVRGILWPLNGHAFTSASEFRSWFLQSVRDDLAEADRGNCMSGIKAATDVLRDGREAFRAAVEFGGLTPAGHRYFVEVFNPIVNRVSFGPPRRRSQEWLALFEAGVLDVAGGPATRIDTPSAGSSYQIVSRYSDHSHIVEVDAIVSARLDTYSPLTDAAPLSVNLLSRGLARPFFNGEYHPGGLDIEPSLRVKDAHGHPHQRIWAIGFVVEGPHFYTHALPRPGIVSRQTIDAEQIVLALYDDLAGDAQVSTELRESVS